MNTGINQKNTQHSTPAILANDFQVLGIQLITDDREWNDFLDRNFPAPLSVKRYLVTIARRTIQGYRHGRWLFAYSESGTPLMVPNATSPMIVTTLNGGSTATLPPVLAGIVTTGLAILGTVETHGEHMDDEDHDRLLELYADMMREGAAIAKTTGYQQAFLALTD